MMKQGDREHGSSEVRWWCQSSLMVTYTTVIILGDCSPRSLLFFSCCCWPLRIPHCSPRGWDLFLLAVTSSSSLSAVLLLLVVGVVVATLLLERIFFWMEEGSNEDKCTLVVLLLPWISPSKLCMQQERSREESDDETADIHFLLTERKKKT